MLLVVKAKAEKKKGKKKQTTHVTAPHTSASSEGGGIKLSARLFEK